MLHQVQTNGKLSVEHNKTIDDVNKLSVSESTSFPETPAEIEMEVDPTDLLDYQPMEEEEDVVNTEQVMKKDESVEEVRQKKKRRRQMKKQEEDIITIPRAEYQELTDIAA